MKAFFRNLLAAFLGSGLAFLAVGVILIFIFVAVITAGISEAFSDIEMGGKKAGKIEDVSVLHITLEDPILERGTNNAFEIDFNTFEPLQNLGLNEIIQSLDNAEGDDRIKGIFLDLSTVNAQPSTLLDIRKAILEFKEESGKWVIAYSEGYTQGTYYLASAADQVYLYPEGDFEWRGLSAELIFFKKMLEKLDIDVQVFRGDENKFKSAVEPFIMDHMSEANEEQTSVFLNDIWNVFLQDIATSRSLSVEELNLIADSLAIRSADDAVSKKMVDAVMYRDQVVDEMRSRLALKDEEINYVKLTKYRYAKVEDKEENKNGSSDAPWEKDRIAVVYAVGEIRSGEGSDQIIGSERVAKALKDAREDEKVKAIVLRVNSPGGSALASDVIWRETQLIKESGKPFVVSMSDLAASGGYYISANADRIFANPNTITGSIGVFGLIPNIGGFMENKLGITFDRVNTNAHSDLTTTHSLDEVQYEAIQDQVDEIYNTFLQRVADGRGMTVEQVDSIAQGRVWTGRHAMELGLVDEMGDLEAAVVYAAAQAGVDDYERKYLPEQEDPFEEFFKSLSGDMKSDMTQEALGDYYETYLEIEKMKNIATMKGVQARIPYNLRIN